MLNANISQLYNDLLRQSLALPVAESETEYSAVEATRNYEEGSPYRKELYAALRHFIQREAGDHSLTYDAIVGPSRKAGLVKVRHAIMHKAKQEFPFASYPELAVAFGGRDHTSIMYAVAKVEGLRK